MQHLEGHNGERNALTDRNSTQYTFEVGHEMFPDLVSRFATAFRNPFFSNDDLESEIRLIDAEFWNDLAKRLFAL